MTLYRFYVILGDLVKNGQIEPYLTSHRKIRFHPSNDSTCIFCPITAVEYFQNGEFVDRAKAQTTATYHDLGLRFGSLLVNAADHVCMCDDTVRMRLLEICKLPTCLEDR